MALGRAGWELEQRVLGKRSLEVESPTGGVLFVGVVLVLDSTAPRREVPATSPRHRVRCWLAGLR